MHRGFAILILAGLIFALGIAIPNVEVPIAYLRIGSLISTILFILLPIMLLFIVSGIKWSSLKALGLILISLGLFGVCYWTFKEEIFDPLWIQSFKQLTIIGWAGGIGILIAASLRDRNLIFPIAIVLATVDLIAVFAPSGTVKQALSSEKGKAIFDAVAFRIPDFGRATPLAQIGPADFLFIAMFFALIFKFGMRTKETAIAMVPTLIVYLIIALLVGPLPALVPIGLVVLFVNRNQFSLSKSEKQMTLGVGIVCAVLLAAVFFRAI